MSSVDSTMDIHPKAVLSMCILATVVLAVVVVVLVVAVVPLVEVSVDVAER